MHIDKEKKTDNRKTVWFVEERRFQENKAVKLFYCYNVYTIF